MNVHIIASRKKLCLDEVDSGGDVVAKKSAAFDGELIARSVFSRLDQNTDHARVYSTLDIVASAIADNDAMVGADVFLERFKGGQEEALLRLPNDCCLNDKLEIAHEQFSWERNG